MDIKARLQAQLGHTREFTEALLEAFQTPEQWTFQVSPGTNHAFWIAGHLGHTDNFLLGVLSPEKRRHVSGYDELFALGTWPKENADDYPPIEEVLAYMGERRECLLGVLDRMSNEDLMAACPACTPDFLKDYIGVFETANWHEAMHSGQLSVVRRGLGHQPMFCPEHLQPSMGNSRKELHI